MSYLTGLRNELVVIETEREQLKQKMAAATEAGGDDKYSALEHRDDELFLEQESIEREIEADQYAATASPLRARYGV